MEWFKKKNNRQNGLNKDIIFMDYTSSYRRS